MEVFGSTFNSPTLLGRQGGERATSATLLWELSHFKDVVLCGPLNPVGKLVWHATAKLLPSPVLEDRVGEGGASPGVLVII
ncbi:hypothetical protein TNCV_4951751 [Trichonephila clavipes]|nr:hypothetical protein TNCV_4951751 [Trichonephila clavipes]